MGVGDGQSLRGNVCYYSAAISAGFGVSECEWKSIECIDCTLKIIFGAGIGHAVQTDKQVSCSLRAEEKVESLCSERLVPSIFSYSPTISAFEDNGENDYDLMADVITFRMSNAALSGCYQDGIWAWTFEAYEH